MATKTPELIGVEKTHGFWDGVKDDRDGAQLTHVYEQAMGSIKGGSDHGSVVTATRRRPNYGRLLGVRGYYEISDGPTVRAYGAKRALRQHFKGK